MTLLHKVEIEAKGRGYDSTIKLDGRDVTAGVRRFKLEQEAGQPSTLELELIVIETAKVEAEDCYVYIHASSEDLLKRLGWTPPAEDPKGVKVYHFGKVAPLDPEDFATRVEGVRRELLDLSGDDSYSDQHRAAYRDASRAIHEATR